MVSYRKIAGVMKSGFNWSRRSYTAKIMDIAEPDSCNGQEGLSIDQNEDDLPLNTYSLQVLAGVEGFATAGVSTKHRDRMGDKHPMVTLYESKGKICWIPWETYRMRISGEKKYINLNNFTWVPEIEPIPEEPS